MNDTVLIVVMLGFLARPSAALLIIVGVGGPEGRSSVLDPRVSRDGPPRHDVGHGEGTQPCRWGAHGRNRLQHMTPARSQNEPPEHDVHRGNGHGRADD